jgi:hypothetical protein
MHYLRIVSFILWLSIYDSSTNNVTAEVAQCHADCQSPIAYRPVGPTRPWDSHDELGNILSLTRPYPYSIAGTPVSVVQFNFTMTIHNLTTSTNMQIPAMTNLDLFVDELGQFSGFNYEYDDLEKEIEMFKEVIKTSLLDFKSYEVEIVEYSSKDALDIIEELPINHTKYYDFGIIAQVKINADHNGYNQSTATSFFLENVRPLILNKIDSGIYRDLVSEYESQIDQSLNRSFSLTDNTTTTQSSFEVINELSVENPNPYTAFCEIGCSLFYSFPNKDSVHLVQCTDRCDELYRYNISVGYNDLAEVARLECRDGCQMALKRCQPGYYCSQVKVIDGTEKNGTVSKNKTVLYDGGSMSHCAAGTYRDVDYHSVEECVPCPPGRFREDIKGHNLESCSKCPAGTYNGHNGSASILDCLRCPAGTFTNQPGSEFCLCITPAACESGLPSPADAEKRSTVPYIGRW